MTRIFALVILLIPGGLAVYGIKLMRDAIFAEYLSLFFKAGIQFIAGLLLFIFGFAFIGGFIVYRDRKNKYRAIPEKQEKDE
ncbi:DUF2627 domain-containing protein [Oceanobacillus bengalensis]|uniref:DUF2627 domain-containing protein n=1 Tax=Oceanobacillus bengalensis TaxID=1435466 RepID=A0A494Z0V0_9BACI|nr:DUF2627 domain-containing protein [Oceanobacillus bengalensis]RKQ16063.1 DUF2627 domain-containing protein [Oceanobacillus bengalensis]